MLWDLVPSKKQYDSWSIPSKLGCIATLLTIFGLLFSVWSLYLAYYPKVCKTDNVNVKLKFHPIFAKENTDYKVLVLSFYNANNTDDAKCVGESIQLRLLNEKENRTLQMQVEYTDSIETPKTRVQAERIRARHNADFLIYGLFLRNDETCSNLDICFRYTYSSEYNEVFEDLKIDSLSIENNFERSSSKSIIEGKFTADIEAVAIWITATSLEKQGQRLKAIPLFERLLDVYGIDDNGVFIQLIKLYNQSNMHLKSLERFKGIDDVLVENNSSLNYVKAQTLFRAKKIDESIRILSELIKTNADYPFQFYLQRASYYKTLSQYEKAIDDYNQLIKRGLKHAIPLRAAIFIEQGKYQHAINDYYRFMEKSVSREDSLYGLEFRAKGLNKMKLYSSAIKDREEIFKIDSSSKSNLNELAYLYLHDGDYEMSLKFAKKALELEPNNEGMLDLQFIMIDEIRQKKERFN